MSETEIVPAPEPEELVLEEETPESEDDGLDELEIGPEKYKVAKPIKEAWNGLQKTVQSEKEALKAREAQIAEREARAVKTEELKAALIDEVAELKGIDKQLSAYSKLTPQDWMTWAEQDPDAARKGQIAYTALQNERMKVLQSAQAKGQELEQQSRKTQAERDAAAERELLAKIKNWTPERAKNVEKVVADAGLPLDVVGPWLKHPAVVTIIEDALAARTARERAAAAREAAAKAKAAGEPEPEPTPRVRANSGASSNIPSDKDPPDVWLKKRQAQLARR